MPHCCEPATAAIPNRVDEYPSGAAAQQAHAVREVALLYPKRLMAYYSAEKGVFPRTEQERYFCPSAKEHLSHAT